MSESYAGKLRQDKSRALLCARFIPSPVWSDTKAFMDMDILVK